MHLHRNEIELIFPELPERSECPVEGVDSGKTNICTDQGEKTGSAKKQQGNPESCSLNASGVAESLNRNPRRSVEGKLLKFTSWFAFK